MSKKIQVNFDDGALEVIERLKQATSANAGDVIRDALSFYEWARQQYDAGRKVGTIENGKGVSEVILPFELRGMLRASQSANGK
ncbi:hypothetical protein GS597_17390 [Synechococcales cyanobacterium C]|uniref:Ribbon-helix-helix protein CopG domain-containing protein n=1 Tax=Petrachloros mirabilis ULC683 TaxID=2781853 RepID=A0A8K1ZZX6_9CYAN|nr:hypothetical protein [Petrachloros mirabilis]NCJ08249.1 hypothetical protein [Petrachloros mirabilis ULC683]